MGGDLPVVAWRLGPRAAGDYRECTEKGPAPSRAALWVNAAPVGTESAGLDKDQLRPGREGEA